MNTCKNTLKNNPKDKSQLLAQIKAIPDSQDFIWNGEDEDERPVTNSEFDMAIKKRGRPAGATKELVSLRLDKDVLKAFRAYGKGWQSKINQVLVDFLKHA